MMDKLKKLERYNLQLPTSLMEKIRTVARNREVPVVDVIRAGIQIMLALDELENKPDAGLYLIQGDEKTRIRPIF